MFQAVGGIEVNNNVKVLRVKMTALTFIIGDGAATRRTLLPTVACTVQTTVPVQTQLMQHAMPMKVTDIVVGRIVNVNGKITNVRNLLPLGYRTDIAVLKILTAHRGTVDLVVLGLLTILALHKLCQCMTLTQFDTGAEIREACTMDVDCKSNSWKFDFVWMGHLCV